MAGNLLSCDYNAKKAYKHSGFSTTIDDSIASGASLFVGAAWDGTNFLCSSRSLTDKIYKFSGFSTTMIGSFLAPDDDISGVGWDSSNVLSCDDETEKIFKHSGFSTTISESIASPNVEPTGVAWDGTNLLSSDYYVWTIFKHSGFTTTILDSFLETEGYYTQGVGWDGIDTLVPDSNVDDILKYSGFSSTLDSSINAPSTYPKGVADDSWNGVPAIIQTLTAKASIQLTDTRKTITAKAKIVCITKAVLVTPANLTIEDSPVYFVWEIPTCCKNRNIHAHIQIDKTDNTFGDLEKDLSSYKDSDFEYWDGGNWQTYPTTGVTSTYYGNQARVQITLTDGSKYWRVKGEVK